MSDHPGDNASSRFRAFWAGVLAFLCFGVVALIVFREERPADVPTAASREIIENRIANLEEINSAQAALVPAEKVAAAEKATIAALKSKKAAKSSVVVPGSDTFMQQMQGGAKPADSAEAEPKKAEDKPAPGKKKSEPTAPEKPDAKKEDPKEPVSKPDGKKPEKPKGKGKAADKPKDPKPESTEAKPAPEKPKTEKPALAPADPAAVKAAMELGQAKYMLCGACHGMDGKGLQMGPGMFMAPAYSESEIVGKDDAEMFALVVLKGIAKQDTKFMGIMAPLEAGLNDEDLAGVLTYVRNTWGGRKDLVTPEQVAGWRAKYSGIKASVKRDELEKLVKETK